MQCPTPLSIKDPNADHASVRNTVPCGQCGICRQNRRSDWTFRLKQEYKTAINAQFITLTYEDSQLPFTDEGVISLDKKELQLYNKRIRKEIDNSWRHKYRYYAVGEYGTKTDRPHYHIIAFNVNPDLHDIIREQWHGGFVTMDPVTPARMHYVSKYHVNAVKKDDDRQPEFAIMSTRPGLGHSYVDRAKKWHRENNYFHVVHDGHPQRMPRYYQEKIFSKLERKIHAKKQIPQIDELHQKEVQRLERLSIDKPESYMLRCNIETGKKVKDKSNRNDKI